MRNLKTILLIWLISLTITVFLLWVFKLPFESHLNNPIKFFQNKECFETKVVHVEDGDYWKIYFTGDNWGWERALLQLNDHTEIGWISVYDISFTGNKNDAIKFAKKFKSYEQCIKHNEQVKKQGDSLREYYKRKGVPTFREYIERNPEQKPHIEEEEIIITNCK